MLYENLEIRMNFFSRRLSNWSMPGLGSRCARTLLDGCQFRASLVGLAAVRNRSPQDGRQVDRAWTRRLSEILSSSGATAGAYDANLYDHQHELHRLRAAPRPRREGES